MGKSAYIFPGLSSPMTETHRPAYDALRLAGISGRNWPINIITYPGQIGYTGDSLADLDLNSAVAALKAQFVAAHRAASSTRLIGLSFGCSVVLKLCVDANLWGWNKIVLWGPTPAFNYWNAFGKGRGRAQLGSGTRISESHFEVAEPFEHLLMLAGQTCDVAVGSEDKYIETTYLPYLRDLLDRAPPKQAVHRYHVVPGCGHTVLPANPGISGYLNLLFE